MIQCCINYIVSFDKNHTIHHIYTVIQHRTIQYNTMSYNKISYVTIFSCNIRYDIATYDSILYLIL